MKMKMTAMNAKNKGIGTKKNGEVPSAKRKKSSASDPYEYNDETPYHEGYAEKVSDAKSAESAVKLRVRACNEGTRDCDA
jgi:hypothetical protein